MVREDLWKHLGVGAAIGALVALLTKRKVAGVVAAGAAGGVKEAADAAGEGVADWRDAAATVGGGMIGSDIVEQARNRKPQTERQKQQLEETVESRWD